MDKPLKEMIFIVLEVFGLSLMIAFVAAMGIPANELNTLAQDNLVVKQSLQEYRDIYLYDNRYVSGDDVISLLQTKKENYIYYVDIDPSANVMFYKVDAEFIKKWDNYVNVDGTPMSAWDTEIMSDELFLNTLPVYDVSTGALGGLRKQSNVYYSKLCRLTTDKVTELYNLNYEGDMKYSASANVVLNGPAQLYYKDEDENGTYEVQCIFFLRDDSVLTNENILKGLRR